MAITFDGNDYLIKDYGGTGPISSYPVTIAAWFKPPQEYAEWQGFVVSDGSETARFGMGPSNYGRWAMFWMDKEVRTGDSYYTNSSPNSWTHSTCIFSASDDRKLYVNGSGNLMTNTANVSGTLADADIVGVGYGPTSGNNALYKGELAECALWNVALTAAEVDSLADGFSPLFIRPNSLVGYWPLGGAFSDYIDPIGGNTLSATRDPAAADHPRIIYPSGPATCDFAVPVVEEEEPAAERGWMFESMQIAVGAGGRRRLSPPNTRTASTNKGWAVESLVVDVGGGGKRRK